MLKEKVYKISITCWILFFVICQIILVGIMGVSLSILNWVETDFDTSFTYITDDNEDQAYFEASSFEGKFVYCGKGCGVPSRDAGFGIVTVSICNFYDDYNDYNDSNDSIDSNDYEDHGYYYEDSSTGNFSTKEYSDSINSICKMFKHLRKAAQFKVSLDALTFVCIVAWFFGMLCMRRKNCCYYYTFISSLFSCSAFFTGSILWFTFSTAKFHSCSENPKNGELPKICATTGPILMVLKMILFAFLVLFYFFVACNAKISKYERDYSHQTNNQPAPRASAPSVNPQPAISHYPERILKPPNKILKKQYVSIQALVVEEVDIPN